MDVLKAQAELYRANKKRTVSEAPGDGITQSKNATGDRAPH